MHTDDRSYTPTGGPCCFHAQNGKKKAGAQIPIVLNISATLWPKRIPVAVKLKSAHRVKYAQYLQLETHQHCALAAVRSGFHLISLFPRGSFPLMGSLTLDQISFTDKLYFSAPHNSRKDTKPAPGNVDARK